MYTKSYTAGDEFESRISNNRHHVASFVDAWGWVMSFQVIFIKIQYLVLHVCELCIESVSDGGCV